MKLKELRAIVEKMVGEPTIRDLDRINKYVPIGFKPVEAIEVVKFPIVGADNLVNRSFGRWPADEVKAFNKLTPGIPLMLDHAWLVDKGRGIVFDSKTIELDEAPDWAMKRAGNAQRNKMAMKRDGRYVLNVAVAAVPVGNPLLEQMRLGMACASYGGFDYSDIICPLCNISFNDEACPHHIPSPYGYGSGQSKDVAPFYERAGLFDVCELSVVWAGNLPAAGLFRNHQLPEVAA